MDEIIEILDIDSDGTIRFSFHGSQSENNSDVLLIDSNTGLIIHRTSFRLSRDYHWWVSSGGANLKWLKNVELRLMHNNEIFSKFLEFPGHSRFLVVGGKKLEVETVGDDSFPMASEIFYDKVYERDFVRVEPGDVIVDVGANYGFFSLYSQNFAPKKIYAIEPFVPVFRCLKKNVNKYNVMPINKSISDESGYALFATTSSGGHNYLTKNINTSVSYKPEKEIIVETITINDLISEYGINEIDFLKIDCEGGELDLFKNIDKDFLNQKITKIALEYHSSAIKNYIIEVLTTTGFVIEYATEYGDEIGYIFAYNTNKS